MISFIAPAYNVNNYLDDFFQSFRRLDTHDFEIIFVDDCGSEPTKKFYEKYKSEFKIKYIQNKKNIGLGFSRNEGLKHIDKKSTHVMYIDTDDYIFDVTFMNEIIKDKITWFNNVHFDKRIEYGYKNKIKNFGKNLFTNTIWGVAIPVKIAREFQFETRSFEDLLVNRRVCNKYSSIIRLSKTPAVAYRFRKSGINSSKPTTAKFNDFADNVNKLIKENINTNRFNVQEIYQYYNMWKPYLKDFDKSKLPDTNLFYKIMFTTTGTLIRWLHIERYVYGRNKKHAFD